jgi:predicted nucleic acid-binding protein
MLAASWLAPMDPAQRRARFADALIAAIADLDGATLVTSDTKIEGVFPVPVLLY